VAIETKGTSAEPQGYIQGGDDSHSLSSSRSVADRPTSHPNSERTLYIEPRRPGETAPAARTFLQELRAKWKYIHAQEGFRRAPLLIIFRLVLWRACCLLRWPVTIGLRGWNVRLSLPARWRGIEKIIFAFREGYEPELTHLKKVLSPGETFVDVGACYGIYTLVASRIVGGRGQVIAFEPSSRAFPILKKNISLNNLTNVRAFCLALSDKSGRTLLYRHPKVGCDSLAAHGSVSEGPQEITTQVLDDVIRELPIDRVGVIKMDVQGAEEWVLRGARNILTTMHPVVIFESWPIGPPLLGLSPNGAWDLLESLGYKFFVLEGDGSLVAVKTLPADCNVVAIYGGLRGKTWAPVKTDFP
jgi:FkbM family methyltransferase